ncbi:MAG: hypothetical protein ACREPB_01695 [Arenimonas sp.]
MQQWIKRIFICEKPVIASSQDGIRLSDDGLHFSSWMSRYAQWPELWPWTEVCEFGISVHQAIYPDPWFGDYMEAEWFFTVQHSEGPQRLFFDIEHFSIDKLPHLLFEHLPGFDKTVLQAGWKEYRAGLRNYQGAGQWLAWQKAGFNWEHGDRHSIANP